MVVKLEIVEFGRRWNGVGFAKPFRLFRRSILVLHPMVLQAASPLLDNCSSFRALKGVEVARDPVIFDVFSAGVGNHERETLYSVVC